MDGMISLYSPIEKMHGIGKARAEKLHKLGIFTVHDLIYYLPKNYENRGNIATLSSLDTENSRSYILTVATKVSTAKLNKGLVISKFRAFDDTGTCEVIFFNSPYVKDTFAPGDCYRFYGKLNLSKAKKLQLTAPKFEPYFENAPLQDYYPVYPLTDGVNSKMLYKLIETALHTLLSQVEDILPEYLRLKYELPSIKYALKNIHSPIDERALALSKKRLYFDEMLTFGLAVCLSKKKRERSESVPFKPTDFTPFVNQLPYELTGAQKRVINEIYKDTVLTKRGNITPSMARIIIGDVGSGKTVCAAAAIYLACCSGYQSAFMAPTEILAIQHYEDLKTLFGPFNFKIALLTGSTKAKEKDEIYKKASSGEIDLVIGTHALLSDKLAFSSLGLIITDEQHRFGVAQRAVLKERQKSAHMLVMSATPIPRTLALALYGDLDVSKIDEMPKGRERVDTFVVDESYRERLNDFIEKQVKLGGQCYVVCPAIEKNSDNEDESVESRETEEMKSAVEYTVELQKRLPDLKIECVHGKLKNAEKDGIMSRFQSGLIDVLVSTTVIEVGVNVPNASLMVVENAERFGLSQLHQLRGRVGRGKRKSYCVLVSDVHSATSRARLDVIRNTYDGYAIAEKDLLLRGPGDFFTQNTDNSFRQSGGFSFKLAKLCNDTELFENAFSASKEIIDTDPELLSEEHILLKRNVLSIVGDVSVIS